MEPPSLCQRIAGCALPLVLCIAWVLLSVGLCMGVYSVFAQQMHEERLEFCKNAIRLPVFPIYEMSWEATQVLCYNTVPWSNSPMMVVHMLTGVVTVMLCMLLGFRLDSFVFDHELEKPTTTNPLEEPLLQHV